MAYEKPRRKHKINHFDFCYGMAVNWVDMETGKMYHIQEYREAIDKGEKPDGIRVTLWGKEDNTVGKISEYHLRNLMEDPEPDPRY